LRLGGIDDRGSVAFRYASTVVKRITRGCHILLIRKVITNVSRHAYVRESRRQKTLEIGHLYKLVISMVRMKSEIIIDRNFVTITILDVIHGLNSTVTGHPKSFNSPTCTGLGNCDDCE